MSMVQERDVGSNMKYKLKIHLAESLAGTIIENDNEWNDWIIDGQTLNHRGSIGEGELAMLLDYMRDRKLTTILEPLSFTCPDCHTTSHNPNDITNQYCGNCHEFKGTV